MNSSDKPLEPGFFGGFVLPTSLHGLARNGAIAGLIKLASAGLAFLMFVAIALVTDERQFGLFGAAFAGASVVSFFNTMGQQSAVLRFWPQYAGVGNLRTAQAFMARSLIFAGTGIGISGLGLAALGALPYVSNATPEWLPLCLASALLAAALGWSEVASAALRAKSILIAGLLPRDIVWRALVIGGAGLLWLLHVEISAPQAVLLTAVLLILAVTPQAIGLIADTLAAEKKPLPADEVAEFRRVASGLWGVTSLPPALSQVSTLLVAAILGPEIAGVVFVAERTTRLVVVALSGINQALAPEISHGFHQGDIGYVQRIASLTALASTAVALVAMVGFSIFGMTVLGIFEPSYATPAMLEVLLIFGAGAVIASACGPVEVLLHVTGSQHALLRILLIVNPIGLVLTALTTYLFGPIGGAISIAGTVAAWNIIAVWSARRRINIDPSLLGILRHLRHIPH